MFGSILRNIAPQIAQAVQQQPQQQAPMQGGGGGFLGGALRGMTPQMAQGMPQQQKEYPTTPSITTLPPPQPGGGMRVGYDDPTYSLPNAGGQLGGLGAMLKGMPAGLGFGGGMPAPMQNPFLGGQPQFIPDAPLPEGMVGTLGGTGFDPVTGRIDLGKAGGSGYYVPQGMTPYKLGQTLGGSSGGPSLVPSFSDYGGRPMLVPPAPQGPGSDLSPEMLQKMLQNNPSGGTNPGVNPFQPLQPQLLPQQQMQQKMQPTSRLLQSVQQQQMQQQQPTRSINPIGQRMAQKIQNLNQKQGIGTGIASLLGRFGGF